MHTQTKCFTIVSSRNTEKEQLGADTVQFLLQISKESKMTNVRRRPAMQGVSIKSTFGRANSFKIPSFASFR